MNNNNQSINEVYARIKEQYPNATLNQLGNGSYQIQSTGEFDLFLPADFSNLDSAYYYYPGDLGLVNDVNGELYKTIRESIEKENSDKVVCLAAECSDKGYVPNVLNIASGGMGYSNYYGMGYSAGARTTLETVATQIEKNPNLSTQTVCLVESAYGASQLDISEKEAKLLGENRTNILLFEEPNGTVKYDANVDPKWLASHGSNVIIVETNIAGDNLHADIPKQIFEQNLIGFMSGNTSKLEALSTQYTYKMYNKSTGEFEVVSAETALNSMGRSGGDDEVKFDPEKTQDAIAAAKKASSAVAGTSSNIGNATALAEEAGADIGDWIAETPEALKQIEALQNIPTILLEIYLEMAPLEGLLADFMSTFNGDINTIPSYVANLMNKGLLNESNVSTFITGLVKEGVLNASNLKDVVPKLIVNDTLSSSSFVDLSIQCSKLLAVSGVNPNGKTNYYDTGYYHDLKITSNPVSEMKNTLTDLMIQSGVSESDATKFSENYISDVNKSLGEMVVNSGLTYTGQGVATMAFAMTGMFATFGYMLDYGMGGTFESDGKDSLMLGSNGKELRELDCNNVYDWLCRCVGINGSGYNAANKAMYAVTIDERLAAGTDYNEYWKEQMANDGRIEYFYSDVENETLNEDFKSGNPGDILVCKNGTHMQVIVGKDANGYYVAEETWISTDENDHGFRIQYYNYDQFTNLKNAYSDSHPYIVHMDNYYANTTNVFKDTNTITYGYDGSVITNNNMGYGSAGDYGHYNNFIPPEVYKEGLGISDETTELMKAQFNYSNENSHVREYNVSEAMKQKAEELYKQNITDIVIPPSSSSNSSQNPTLPNYGVPNDKTNVPEYSAPVQKPITPEYNVPVQKPTMPEYDVPVQKPTMPEYDVPVQKPVTPEYDVPVQKPTMPEYDVPVQKPVTPEYDVPVQKPVTPEYDVPVQKPITPEYNAPVQKPVTPEYDVPVQKPVTPEYDVPEVEEDNILNDNDIGLNDSDNSMNEDIFIDISKPEDDSVVNEVPKPETPIIGTESVIGNDSKDGNGLVGTLLGATAIAGAAAAGKFAYDKVKENKEDENIEDKYYEDFDISKDKERYEVYENTNDRKDGEV